MFGIVTILEGQPGAQVKKLWSDLSARYGADAVKGLSIPHLTYQAADDYDKELVEALLERVAANTQEFTAPAAGLGVIHRDSTLLFINLVRTPALSALHEDLWDDATAAGSGVVPFYSHGLWFPHVTLADQPSLLDKVPDIAAALGAGRLPRDIPINNLALIEETRTGHELRFRVSLRG